MALENHELTAGGLHPGTYPWKNSPQQHAPSDVQGAQMEKERGGDSRDTQSAEWEQQRETRSRSETEM